MRQLTLSGGKVDDCTFCRIVRGELRAHLVFEDQAVVAFLDSRPLFLGHTLIVPKEHHQTLGDLPSTLIPSLFSNARLLSKAVEEAMKADGTFVAINNRMSQSVPHLHIHVIPRRQGDGLKGFFWPRTKYIDEKEMDETQAAIKRAMEELTNAG